jgi:hypothetical protein
MRPQRPWASQQAQDRGSGAQYCSAMSRLAQLLAGCGCNVKRNGSRLKLSQPHSHLLYRAENGNDSPPTRLHFYLGLSQRTGEGKGKCFCPGLLFEVVIIGIVPQLYGLGHLPHGRMAELPQPFGFSSAKSAHLRCFSVSASSNSSWSCVQAALARACSFATWFCAWAKWEGTGQGEGQTLI